MTTKEIGSSFSLDNLFIEIMIFVDTSTGWPGKGNSDLVYVTYWLIETLILRNVSYNSSDSCYGFIV